jgi:hypothetical protein
MNKLDFCNECGNLFQNELHRLVDGTSICDWCIDKLKEIQFQQGIRDVERKFTQEKSKDKK